MPPSAQAANAQAAGAAAVLVVNNDDTGFFRMDQEADYAGAAVTIPVGGMPQVSGARLPLSDALSGVSTMHLQATDSLLTASGRTLLKSPGA